MNQLHDNPMGTDGFEFLEFSSPEPKKLKQQFEHMGFVATAKHKNKNITLYQQGEIRFLLNEEPNTQAARFSKMHGAGCCAMGFRIKDAKKALKRALALGATEHQDSIFKMPAIQGIGETVIYFVDCTEDKKLYENDFKFFSDKPVDLMGAGLFYIDHLTHNVQRGRMDQWAKFYEDLFNFREIRYFDIKGKMTGLISRALSSPCGKIKIPLNESTDDQSQIEEFLHEFNGEGIQHIALGTKNIYQTIETLKNKNIPFLDTPDTYYELIDKRVPEHHENVPLMKKHKILIDGNPVKKEGLLLQIFTANMLGPVFFEIIQRKGNEGFGEGNFKALFEAIELDQIRRGVLRS